MTHTVASRLWLGLVIASYLPAATAEVVAAEQWELIEETMSAGSAPRSAVVARFPTLEACPARAAELSAAPDAAPDASPRGGAGRLGFTCLQAAPPERAPAQR